MKKLFCTVLLLISIPFFAAAQDPTVSSVALLHAQIQNLLKQIQNLQQQVTELKTELGVQPEHAAPAEAIVSEAPPPPELTRTLSRGSSGDDVRALQEFLSRDKEIYPEGLITGYFGSLTQAAVRRWQTKHGVESAGIIGPKTITQFKEAREKKAEVSAAPVLSASPAQPVGERGATRTIPAIPALPAQSATTTSTQSTSTPASPTCATNYAHCRAKTDCEKAGFFWYTVSCHQNPPRQSSCAASYTYCSAPAECAAGGWYWCRNSCYGSVDACLGQSYTPPAVPPAPPPAIIATPATPAIPAQPIAQTGTTTVPAVPAIPAQTATTTTTTTPPSGSVPVLAPPTEFFVDKITNGPDAQPPKVGYAVRFNYLTSSALKSFNIYVKKPSDSGFAKYNQTDTYWSYLSDTVEVGEHKFYVTAVNTAGVEGPSTAVKSMSIYPSPTISNPASGATVSVPFQINVINNAPQVSGQHFAIYVFWSGGFWSTDSTNLSVPYGGPALNPAHNPYRVVVHSYDGDAPASHFANTVLTSFHAATSAGPPAPTNLQVITTSGNSTQPPEMWYYLFFNYTLQSTTQSFNLYRKRPTDASFVKYTYNVQTTGNSSILPGSNESTLYRRPDHWEWWTKLPSPAPETLVGEYRFYVTAVDTNGVESTPSETKSFKLYAAPVITSPADGATVSVTPTITISGDPNAQSPTYGIELDKKITGGTAWLAWPAPGTNFTYAGPTLNQSDNPHRLVVWFTSNIYDRSLFGTSIFNISTTASARDLRAENLAAVSQAVNAIKEKLLKLLQEF